MKRLNNKGMTLTEVLVSIVLLGVVMIFAYGIVNQLIYVKNSNATAVDNQINRALIIDTIQNDLVVYGLSYTTMLTEGFSVSKDVNTNMIIFKMTTYRGASYIYLTKNELVYKDFTGRENKWTLKGAFSTTDLPLEDYYMFSFDGTAGTATIRIKIPIYTNNPANDGNPNNNINDDINIIYYGPYFRLN